MTINDLQVGDLLVWKRSWGGYRWHPGPFTVTHVLSQIDAVQLAEGNPPHHQYHYPSFFTRGWGTYECTHCDHVGYLQLQTPVETICTQCYNPMRWTGLTEKS